MDTNMLKRNILIAVMAFLGICQTFGQDKNTAEETSMSLVESLGPENLQIVLETQIDLSTITANSIYIQQIGSGNSATANIQTENNELNLLQNGNSNRTKIDVAGKTVLHNLVQNGNNNFLMEYGNSSNLNLERNIIQNGNDHGVVIFGSNSLTDKIILNLQGNSKTITIRNFN
ncbi:MAG: hypothetical protein ACR2MT_03910 [Aurantibacter sp.]